MYQKNIPFSTVLISRLWPPAFRWIRLSNPFRETDRAAVAVLVDWLGFFRLLFLLLAVPSFSSKHGGKVLSFRLGRQ